MERPKGGRRSPQGNLGGAGRCEEGGVSLQGGGDAETKASEAQGEGDRPRASAVAAPETADGAYAAHFEREGDMPISAVAATRKRNASMAEGGGPCRCTSLAYATTCSSVNVRWTFFRASSRVKAKKKGPRGSPWRSSRWEERGGTSEGDPPTTRSPWARCVQPAKGRSRRARQATACQKGLPSNAVESVLEVKLQGHVVWAAEKACAEHMAHALVFPWDADAKL
jgi:hypothetical protein